MSDSDAFSDLFAPEPAPSTSPACAGSWKVLLVDDELAIHAAVRLALQNMVVKGNTIKLLDAQSTAEARIRLAEHPDIALILLDVVMETPQAGLELVHYIRQDLGNQRVQIVLVTGQPGYAPHREVVTAYAIDGYRLKSELNPDNLFVTVHAALRTYQTLYELIEYRQTLEAIVEKRIASLFIEGNS